MDSNSALLTQFPTVQTKRQRPEEGRPTLSRMSSSAVPMEPISVPYERFGSAPDLDAVPAYKWWAVFNIACCCLPLGIVAVYYAGEVEERLAKRDFEGAKSASKTALILNIICMLCGLTAFSFCIYYFVHGI